MSDDYTPPHGTARAAIGRALRESQDSTRRVNSLEEEFGKVIAEVGRFESRVMARIDALEQRMGAGFERMGELLDDALNEHRRDKRRAEDSHHDLSEELQKTRRILMLKNVSLPTAIVLAVVLVGYFTLLAMGKPVPNWVIGAVGVVGTAMTAALPALLGGKTSS